MGVFPPLVAPKDPLLLDEDRAGPPPEQGQPVSWKSQRRLRNSQGRGLSGALSASQVSCPAQSLGQRDPRAEGNGSPLQYSCLGNAVDRGAWWATIPGVTRVGHDLATKLPGHPRSTEVNPVWQGPGEVIKEDFPEEVTAELLLDFFCPFLTVAFLSSIGFWCFLVVVWFFFFFSTS